MQNYRPFLIIAMVLAIAIVSGVLSLRNSSSSKPPISSAPSPGSSNVAPAIPNDVVIQLEEFGDYQCPPCGALHPSLKKMKQDFGTHLNLIFRNLPLTPIHKNALVAAQAAEAARMQDHFWEMHDLLYENQDLWKEDVNPKTIFLKFASDLGLDTARFSRDMDGKPVQERIEADQNAASELGINGTPTILLDGRQLRPEVTTPDGVRKGVELMFARHAAGIPTP